MNEDRRYASRKFLLTLLVLMAATALRVMGLIDPPAWADVVKWALGLYMAGNVGSWAVDAMKAKQ